MGSRGTTISRLLQALAAAIVILMLTAAAAAAGGTDDPTRLLGGDEPTQEEVAREEVGRDESKEDQSVTVTIELEEGGVIDLELTRGDVVVETWDGEEFLVIVEKMRTSGLRNPQFGEPISIQVSRRGKDVCIAAYDQFGRQLREVDLAFRVRMPRSRNAEDPRINQVYDLSKLTSVVWRALHREVLRWIVR